METSKIIDLSELAWPAAIALIVVCFITSIKGCSEHADIEATKRTQAYISNGCEKTSIRGSTGTHWVCENTANTQ